MPELPRQPDQALGPATIIEHVAPVLPGQTVLVFNPRKVAAIISAAFCVLAGLYLLAVEPADKDNRLVFFSIAHGMGAYFIGKGIFCGAELWGPVTFVTPVIKHSKRLPRMARTMLRITGVALLVIVSMVAGLFVHAHLPDRTRDIIDYNIEGKTR